MVVGRIGARLLALVVNVLVAVIMSMIVVVVMIIVFLIVLVHHRNPLVEGFSIALVCHNELLVKLAGS
jgi:hypothetical protein